MREILLERLRTDLIGPYAKDEVLTSRPTDIYLTGILWPRETRMGAEDDERLGVSGQDDDGVASDAEEEISLVGLVRPCSAGVSFAASAENGKAKVNVRISFATYEQVEVPGSDTSSQTKARRMRPVIEWRRRYYDVVEEGVSPENPSGFVPLQRHDLPPGVKLHVRSVPWSHGALATVTLLNDACPDENEGRAGIERLTLFQVCLEIRPTQGTKLVARPSRRAVVDDDDSSAELLYRNAHEYATGHTCSVKWELHPESGEVGMVGTAWIPQVTVPATSARGHEVFDVLRNEKKCRPLSARWLATAKPEDIRNALQALPEAYKKWIDQQESGIPEEFREQAERNIRICREVQERISNGISRISADRAMSQAFSLANLAMDLQHGWDSEKSALGPLEWRPFQLGFILLAAVSVVDRRHPERQIMDLLWFPTGGGKTEAYLALIAFLAFYRRFSAGNDPDKESGVAAIMRYTLRLLTTQQFVRAASVMLACEAIRRGRIHNVSTSYRDLGNSPFSIGLWVGGDAVPNRVSDAAAALMNGDPDQPTPKQIVHCPACKERLNWFHDEQAAAIYVRCENTACVLFDSEAPLPIWTVDEDVYRQKPTLLIGTVDKFAQIVRRKEINGLFGLDGGSPPDLILQDELHLISGPLGTVAGLYEVAIDRMFSVRGVRPKIIGSTATIRRASEQVKALFDRQTAQFPPPCLNAGDSAFAVVDRSAPGRVYAGITTAGRSAKFTLQAVAASLLQSALGGAGSDEERDPYWTLVSYFNSLRELGGALVLMQDDVNDTLGIIARKRGESENQRRPEFIEELTSRRTQSDVRDMLTRLAVKAGRQGALDVVLATNMLSVGVDIPRLGLMLVNGQPKGIAEYIQATSRVGRGNVPGLVVAVLNNAKARDRSHYESFPSWHETLYRDVEPTSVTPFASRARDRALHAVLVTLVRHLIPRMLERPMLDQSVLDAAKDLINDIVQRAALIDPDEKAVRSELERYLDIWEFRAPGSYWHRQVRNSLLQDAEWAATQRAMGRLPGEAWPTLNNMRSVEPSTRFRLAERLRLREPSEE